MFAHNSKKEGLKHHTSRWRQLKYFLFSPRTLGKIFQFDVRIFFKGVGSTTNRNFLVQYYPLDPKTMKNEGFRPPIYGFNHP